MGDYKSITNVQKNGRTYAYAHKIGMHGYCTEYLGIINEESGTIRTPRRRLPPPRRQDGAIRAMELGNVLVLDHVAESSGLKDDLKEVFGDRWSWILALAMAQAIRPTSMKWSMETMNKSCIAEILDLEYPVDGHVPIQCSITHAELTAFYTSRHKRSDSFFMSCMHIPKIIPSYVNADRYDRAPLWGNGGYNVLISISSTGEPIGLMVSSGTPSKVSNIIGFIENLVSRFGSFQLILDQKFTDAGNLPLFLKAGVDIVTTTSMVLSPVVPIINRMFTHGEGEIIRAPNKRTYMFGKGSVGLTRTNNYTAYISEDDYRYDACESYISVFPTLDLDFNRKDNEALRHRLSDVIKALDGTIQDDPVVSFQRTAREVARYLRMSLNDDGTVNVSTRDDILEHDMKLSGLTVVLSSTLDLYGAWNLFSSASNIMSDLTVLLDSSKEQQGNMFSGEHMFDRMVKMISAMMLSEIRRTLKVNGYVLDPRDALHLASKYMLIDTGDDLFTTDPDRSASKILELFE